MEKINYNGHLYNINNYLQRNFEIFKDKSPSLVYHFF